MRIKLNHDVLENILGCVFCYCLVSLTPLAWVIFVLELVDIDLDWRLVSLGIVGLGLALAVCFMCSGDAPSWDEGIREVAVGFLIVSTLCVLLVLTADAWLVSFFFSIRDGYWWPWAVAALAAGAIVGLLGVLWVWVIKPAFIPRPRYWGPRPSRARWATVLAALFASVALPIFFFPHWNRWRHHEFCEYHTNKGELFVAKGDADAALAELDRVISRDPTSTRAYAARAVAHNIRKEYELCLTDLAVIIAQSPEEHRYRPYRAELLVRLGRLDEATRDRLLDAFTAALSAATNAEGRVSFEAPYAVVTARKNG